VSQPENIIRTVKTISINKDIYEIIANTIPGKNMSTRVKNMIMFYEKHKNCQINT
jgi:hypothetical protein